MTQQDLQVKTSKIVAGLEADKTNELLQAIAFALDNKLDSTEAVNFVKNGAVIQSKSKTSKVDAKQKSQPKVNSKQPPSRDRTPAKAEPKKQQLITQRSTDKKNGPLPTKTTTATTNVKEKSNKSTTKSNVNDTKKLKKTSSKDGDSLKIEEKILTNGSHENHSLTPPRQNSHEKNDENDQQVQIQPQIDAQDDGKENEEPKVNGDVNHNEINQQQQPVTTAVIENDKESEPIIVPATVQKPQDELAAIIDEEAEYRRKEKSSKRLSSRHRQKSVENESQEKQVEAASDKQQLPQDEKIEKFKTTFKRESVERPRTSLRPPSARPASSRPAAPRRRDKNVEIVLQPEENLKLGNIQVKMENFSKELEDDGENLIIIEDPSASNDNTDFLNERLSKNASSDSNEASPDHGHLVQQILETEKNFEGALGMDGNNEQQKKTEIVSETFFNCFNELLNEF